MSETLVALGPQPEPSSQALHLQVDAIPSVAIAPANGLVPSGCPITAVDLPRLGVVEDSIYLLVNALRSEHSQLILPRPIRLAGITYNTPIHWSILPQYKTSQAAHHG